MNGADYRAKNTLPAWYAISVVLVGSAANTGTLILDQDSEFEMWDIFGSSTQDADTDFMPNNFSVMITDQGSGRRLSNIRIPQRNICGPANGAYRLPMPVIFPPNANLLFDVLDLSTQASTATIVLCGYKRFLPVQ